jgi:dipeptidyl aminopeptidase/acylaminoacyl peptidase
VIKDPPKSTPLADELKREQRELFDFVKKQRADSDSAVVRARRDRAPMPMVTPAKQTDQVSSIDLSPDGKYVTYIVTPRVENTQTIYADYVNATGVVEQKTSRPKVGETTAIRRAAIVRVDPLADPDSVKPMYADTAGLGKPVLVTGIQWNRQGTHLVVEFQSVDYKDMWTVLVDPATGKRIRTLDHEHDDAWLGGAGRTGGRHSARWMTFLADGEELAVTSERTGWAHLYILDMQGKATPLTSGEWEVRSVELSRDGTKWWLTTSKEHPDETHVYTLPLRGGEMTRIDKLGEGETRFALTPDEGAAVLVFASPRELDEIYIQPTVGGAATRVTKSGTDAFYKIAWAPSDFVSFADDQGKPIFARVYRPRKQHPNRPAVLEIHGAGYAQGVHKAFGSASAHGGPVYAQYLADRGITYMVIDYRGSAGYGRDSRTAIYRDMGNRDVASAVAAVPFLASKYQVDPKRVGLFGCSYGGFYTLMALFRHPGTFAAGAAQCSVTDWAHYNHSYTARILNGAPPADTAAYRTSSPIFWAAGLKDRLLLQHGLVDGNVEYQDAIRLVQRLMELHKDFEFVTYPVEGHGWFQTAAKLDSQRRVTKLWEETLLSSGSVTQAGQRR